MVTAVSEGALCRLQCMMQVWTTATANGIAHLVGRDAILLQAWHGAYSRNPSEPLQPANHVVYTPRKPLARVFFWTADPAQGLRSGSASIPSTGARISECIGHLVPTLLVDKSITSDLAGDPASTNLQAACTAKSKLGAAQC